MPRSPSDPPGPKGAAGASGGVPQGRWSRGLELGKALLGGVRRSKNARKVADTLGAMKGVSMKLGQTLSYLDLHAPEEWQAALGQLQHRSEPMPHHVVAQVVAQDLGAPPDEAFQQWDREPAAAASIGQVHRARLADGTAVAVKVRYPDVDRAIEADLANLKIVANVGSLFAGKLDTPALLDEVRERFLEECDYRLEAEHQATFRDFFRDDANVVVPEVYPSHSSERVLTTAWFEGRRFDDFVRVATQESRDRAARAIHNFAFRSIYHLGALNCDPHPGNYLFSEDAVAFLDFGCVRRFPIHVTRTWRDMIRSALERDLERFRDAVVRIGLASEHGRFDFRAHYEQYLFLLGPWLTTEPHLLTSRFVSQSYRELAVSNPNRRHLRMPPELLFANRLQWGLYSVLARLGPNVSLREEMLGILYEPHEERPEPFDEEELSHIVPSGFRRGRSDRK